MTIKLPERDPRMSAKTNLIRAIAEYQQAFQVHIWNIEPVRGERGEITGIDVEAQPVQKEE